MATLEEAARVGTKAVSSSEFDASDNAVPSEVGSTHSAGQAGLHFYERLFGTTTGRRRRSLDRTSLPTPLSYLTEHRLLRRRPRRESAAILCPIHKAGAERHPSMLVSLVDGHFRCMSCGVKGGDILALHRLITGLNFKAAVQDLGGRFHDD